MKKHSLSARRLAIIGNGFDLAHGLKTSYQDFVAATGADVFSEFRDLLTEYCGTDVNWHEFEHSINELTIQCFHREMNENENVVARAQVDLQRIHEQFRIFHKKLIDYLYSATHKHNFHRLPNVRKYLPRHTVGISFNYTDTAAHYIRDVLYVHGSLAEDDILLGYDFRDEPCIASYNEMQWSKDTCRTLLAFRRYLRDNLHLRAGTLQYNELLKNFEDIEALRLSNRGFENEDIIGWTYEDVLRKYLIYETSHGSPLDVLSLRTTREIVVLGHSIKSDQVYLQQLLARCPNLQKVTIFSYSGEPRSEWEEKADFFKPYCKKIQRAMYTNC